MARRHCFSYWLLVCWLVVTVAEALSTFYLQQHINLHMDKKRYLRLLEIHKIMRTLPTARSLHSPLHLPRGVRSQGPSPSQRHPGVPSIFFHEGPESILGFQTDLSSLQGVTTVFHSSHFIGHTVTLLIGISPEEDSREEAHLRKAEREEKPKHTEAKKSLSFRKKQQKDFCFIFRN
ncbi:odontogenesis associated phosphoprotein [Homo sapiens]|uniref:Isoform 2 of Odontogenesis associated phosphoprotein n=1 Tax=Homo sapiens TaxID=9606 RepID=Q17RF5-2|nr:odontogenesis associated phosphoprotein isoform 1 precursor [Homo sapiens]KAI4025773.1 odontogenesis associated phosphoprotein [Homo sapiens]|eukprot:NP_001193910.1 odontogenesis associated phosphoprotein isoform 1 precursor [Homo sapiens]